MQVDFLTELHVHLVSKNTWRLSKGFTASLLIGDEPMLIHVPLGFVTDFASVPRLPFVFWLAGNRAPKSATLHDYLYAAKAGRDFADDVFYYAMEAEGIQKWVAKLMWSGVRLGGARRYDSR